jgi:redox-sensitive bicupin YhaK (pirin superfamily)
MSATAAIEMTIAPRSRPVGSGKVERLLPVRQRRMVGPFIFCDHIGPDELPPGVGVDVPAHPHIGLSTLTYLFDGSMVHRDSVGSVQTIEPGAVNWMTAGRGVAHTERSGDRSTERAMHGLQLWVALPHDTEDSPASFDHQPAAAIPTAELDGARVRLMAGSGYGLQSPVPVSSPLVLAELHLDGTATLPLDATHTERALLALDGDVRLDRTPLPVGHLTVVADGSTPVLDGSGTVVVLGGEPVGPRYIWWNFVHSDRDVIEQAKADWTAQRFPIVPGDQDGWVPLPGA